MNPEIAETTPKPVSSNIIQATNCLVRWQGTSSAFTQHITAMIYLIDYISE